MTAFFFAEVEKMILKVIELQGSQIPSPPKKKILKKKNKVRELTVSDFKSYHKAIVIKTVWYWRKTDKHMD